ncbi:MAG: VWA domain-containing protein [Clostridia bacterium]|nr:VWA domain-containing protein [Clostridia bacterium]MBO5754504.1 VWA domain-containing protein [Clostridia bacterium]MBO7171206.1 VWA domain-containing protein [Clostridia bacterium]
MKTTNKNTVQNDLTEIVFILDRSGSMAGYEEDTIGGFNAAMAEQRGKEGRVLVSTLLFDNETAVLHDRLPLEDIPTMTRQDYRVGGCTALLDAIGGAIHHIGNIHKYARAEDVPERTLFLITTDGQENASSRYDSATVKKMIERQREKYGWEFIFLAANIDAVETAKSMGIREDRTGSFEQTPEGVRANYERMCEVITTVRCRKSLDDGTWRKN